MAAVSDAGSADVAPTETKRQGVTKKAEEVTKKERRTPHLPRRGGHPTAHPVQMPSPDGDPPEPPGHNTTGHG